MTAASALLVVDDNEDNRYTLTQRLKRLGYENVATAVDGRDALSRLRQELYDLVLLDVMMPELNGYEVLEQMKAGYIQVEIDQQPYEQGFLPVMQVYLEKKAGLAPSDIDSGEAVFTPDQADKVMAWSKENLR